MTENLSYLFLSGIILGSGPCLGFCAPFLIAYTAVHKAGWKASFVSYGIFSCGRLLSYILWGLVCALGAAYLQSEALLRYSKNIYLVLGCFIVVLGIATCFSAKDLFGKACQILHQGNIRNVGIAGFLVGLSPCLPLWGIFNYVVLIAKGPADAVVYLLAFGLGTVLSPLALCVVFSGKFAQVLSTSPRTKALLQYACGALLVFLGAQVILRVF